MISKSSKHAILALTFLARLPEKEYAGANQIAEKIKAPKNYLGKILKKLAEEGYLESVKGYNGGFKLSKPASEINIYSIVNPIENLKKWNLCFMGTNECGCDTNCAVHENWHKIRQDYFDFLKCTSLEMIASANIKIDI